MAKIGERQQSYKSSHMDIITKRRIVCLVCVLIMVICLGFDIFFIQGIISNIF